MSVGFLLVIKVSSHRQCADNHCRYAGLTIMRVCASGNKVSLVSILTGVRIKQVNFRGRIYEGPQTVFQSRNPDPKFRAIP